MNITKLVSQQIKNDFLMSSLILYIKRKIITKFYTKLIINEFHDLKNIEFRFDKS